LSICASSPTSQSKISLSRSLRQFGDTVLESLADVAEGELRALFMAGLGDAVGDRAVAQHAGDQQFFAGKKAHEVAS
jgi:hypothetical protein